MPFDPLYLATTLGFLAVWMIIGDIVIHEQRI
jgi:hypothetical protein